MPTYEVKAPDGKTFKVNAPDGASQDDAIKYVQDKFYKSTEVSMPKEDKGMLQNLAMGALNGAAQIGTTLLTPVDALFKKLGISNDYIGRDDRRGVIGQFMSDKANPDSLAFKGGELASEIAGTSGIGGVLAKGSGLLKMSPEIAAALESGGLSLGGKTASTGSEIARNIATRMGAGATVGGLSTLAVDPNIKDVATGAGIGAIVPPVVATAGQIGKAAKAALYDPLVNQDKIIGGMLSRAVGNTPLSIAEVPKTTGVNFSLGQQTGNPAINAIEDALKAKNPAGALGMQDQVNRVALSDQLRGIAQTPEALEAAKEARNRLASPLYEQAWTEFNPDSVTPWVKGQITQLLKRPAVQQAMEDAKNLALNRGMKLDEGNTVQGLHFAKLALDDQISNAVRSGDKNAVIGLMDSKDKLLGVLNKLSDTYASASQMYGEMSRPVNQMQIGNYLANKLIPATAGDIPATLNAATLARSLQNPDQVAKTATKFSGAKLETALDPDQLASVMGVNSDASRIAEIAKQGAGFGSPTARRLATSDYIGQHIENASPLASKVVGLLGNVPAVNWLTKLGGAAGNMVGGKINAKMAQELEDMLAKDPQKAKQLIAQYLQSQQPSGLLEIAAPGVTPAAVGLTRGLLSPASP